MSDLSILCDHDTAPINQSSYPQFPLLCVLIFLFASLIKTVTDQKAQSDSLKPAHPANHCPLLSLSLQVHVFSSHMEPIHLFFLIPPLSCFMQHRMKLCAQPNIFPPLCHTLSSTPSILAMLSLLFSSPSLPPLSSSGTLHSCTGDDWLWHQGVTSVKHSSFIFHSCSCYYSCLDSSEGGQILFRK